MADVLVVASKVKAYVAKQSLRTSSTALDALSKLVEAALDKAVRAAEADGRVTIKDDDIPELGESDSSGLRQGEDPPARKGRRQGEED